MPAAQVAVIIPARYASTRLPAKPLTLIAGRPLIQHVWARCVRAKGIVRVIVATDDQRIADVAQGFGAEVAMTSPRHRSGTDRIAEVAKKLPRVTHLINVQGDEPLVDPGVISRLAATMLKDRTVQMITVASRFGPDDDLANPNMVKVVVDRAGDALYFSRSPIPYLRSDGLRPAFLRHQGIYGYTRDFLLQFVRWKPTALELAESLEQLRALENGAKIRVIRTPAASLSVDTPDDVRAVEKHLSSCKSQRSTRS
jgi:3-deoxy-manno-octulosonate cytidylyltransferase (CMP-KDO synthetase)